MTDIIVYKCPACGGRMEFDSKTQHMKCLFCKTELSVEEYEAQQPEADLSQSPNEENGQWMAANDGSWQEGEAGSFRVYACATCGGEIVGDLTEGAASCPFCGNPVVMKGQFSGELKPDYIIPFRHDKKAAKQAYYKHLEKKYFMPRVFKNENHIDEIRGIYVPFWLFDADVEASVQYAMTETDSWESGGYIYTKSTEHAIYREGEVAFAGIPCDCSKKMDDTLMEAIEPYHFRDAVPFRAAYLAGYVADRYDVDMQDCIARATKRAQASTEKEMKYGLQSKGTITVKSNRIQVKSATYHYALYPVWILNTTWRGKQYTFAMNGQTGRMVGDLPFSRKEFWKYVIPRGMIAGAGIYAVLECFMVLSAYQWTTFHLVLMILAVLALVGLIRLLSK